MGHNTLIAASFKYTKEDEKYMKILHTTNHMGTLVPGPLKLRPNATPASPEPSSVQFNPGETSGARQPRLSHQSTFSHSFPFVNSHYSPPIGSLSKPSFPSSFINSLQRREFDYKSQADPGPISH